MTVLPNCLTYTLDADFKKGTLVGLVATNHQLELTREAVTLPFIWVPNSNDGTVSKVDTWTGQELGRYRTGPGPNGSPSRTTVDQQGNCWVANRVTATVLKIGLFENGQYLDRNGNGKIETSQDLDGDGNITGQELLPWGRDECVLYETVLVPGREGTFVPGTYQGVYANDYWNPGPRGIAVDAPGNVWVGTYGTQTFYYLDGITARIKRTVDVSSVNHTDYGAVIDARGILWSAGHDKNQVLRLNPVDNTFSVVNVGHFVYGLGIDKDKHLFVSGWEASKLSRINVATGAKEWTVNGVSQSRGLAVTEDGDVWVANSGPGTVTRWSNDGTVKATISVGSQPTGVAVDAAGKVWVVNVGDEYIHRIDPANNSINLSKRILGGTHYGYSDMTGFIARNITTRLGVWTVVHDSLAPDTAWGIVSWNGLQPEGTAVRVRVWSSNTTNSWLSSWETTTNGVVLATTPKGRYLQIEATLQITSGTNSPVLYDLTACPAAQQRIVRVVNSSGTPGMTIGVPIELDAQGDENTVAFTLVFDPMLLQYQTAQLGTDLAGGSQLMLNTNLVQNGRLGVLLGLPAGQVFTAGTRQIVMINFQIGSGVLVTTNTPVKLEDEPVTRAVVSVGAQILPADFVNGLVTVNVGWEADVFPRPTGDGKLTAADWTLIGRFVVGLDPLSSANEFMRTDCSPRTNEVSQLVLGDGKVFAPDWTQAGRYVAGLDPLTLAGGPIRASFQFVRHLARLAPHGLEARMPNLFAAGERVLRAANVRGPAGNPVRVPIELLAAGDENTLGFSVAFDPNILNYRSATLGDALVEGSALILNTNQTTAGRLGVLLALPAGQVFSAGPQQVLMVEFQTAPLVVGTNTLVEFADQPVPRQIVSANVQVLPASYFAGTVELLAAVTRFAPPIVLPNGQIKLMLTGPPGLSYVVETSTDFTAWTPMATNAFTSQGQWEYVDQTAGQVSRRFYRAIQQ